MPDDPIQRPHTPDRHRVPVALEQALAAAAMALICVISFANVVVRYFTNVSFAFTEEFSVFLLVFMTFVGASAAFAKAEHIRIGVFVEKLPPRFRFAAEALSLLATTFVFSFVLYYGALFALDQWRYDETSPGLGYPQWIYSVWLPILAGAILLRVLGRGVALIRKGPR